MAKKGFQTVTISEEADEKLNAFAEKLGISKAKVVLILIEEYEKTLLYEAKER